jgi:hypothetical protein
MRPARASAPLHVNAWWPDDLGVPASSGTGEQLRYAYFSMRRLLLIDRDGVLKMYDTGEHQFRGVLQAAHGDASSLTFLTQKGRVDLHELREVMHASR